MNIYQVNVSYSRQTGEDNPGKVREAYLTDGINCSDAEKKVLEFIEPYIFQGECDTPQIRKRQFFDIVKSPGENWYEVKAELIETCEDKEIRKKQTFLVRAEGIRDALDVFADHLITLDHETISVKKSSIVDVL
jgi:hypothetical protein